jgi:hypothetical protein
MQSTWHRLSSRLSGVGGLIGINWRDAISPDLEESLRRWIVGQVGPHFLKMELSYYDQVNPNSLISLLDLRIPDFKDSDDTENYSTPYVRDGKLKARFIAYGTPIELVPDIVDAVLHLQVGFIDPLSFNPALDPGRKVLEELLEDSPVLRMRADGNGLERWSDVMVEETFAEAVRSAEMADRSGSADRHLRMAWECVHAAEPDPVRSYSEAIKAVEAAAHAVVESDNPNATLGSMIRKLRTHPESVSLAISGRDGLAGDTRRLVACLELLWKGQSARHGSAAPTRPETLEEATMAVHLAVTLVQWFTSGAVRRTDASAS